MPNRLLVLLAFMSTAQAQMPPGGGPPPQAFGACDGVAVGGTCRFQAPHGAVEGECRVMREARPVCVPAMPGRQPGMGPGNRPSQARAGNPQGRIATDIVGDNPAAMAVTSRLPDTHQGGCFDNDGPTACPARGAAFFGQDAQYLGRAPAYRDNGNGTVADLVTGLTWEKAHHDQRLDQTAAAAACAALDLGGHRDWRLPSIKELFSLADFRGSQGRRPFIDDVFEFREPGPEVLQGDRFAASHHTGMMGQTWSATRYTGVHFGRPGVEAAFFFNFLDGHIKQAPTRGGNRLFYRCVRGPVWGENQFINRGGGIVEDRMSGLLWQQTDDGKTRDWREALAYCANLELAGERGWRLPNVKELQSIVDYSRHAPALDPRHLRMSDTKAWFWSSTTHGDNLRFASYVCFGPCTDSSGLDVHGAGAQRSDPKTGDPARYGSLGGQQDEVRIRNAVRCVK